jgi:hypothetical protein
MIDVRWANAGKLIKVVLLRFFWPNWFTGTLDHTGRGKLHRLVQ